MKKAYHSKISMNDCEGSLIWIAIAAINAITAKIITITPDLLISIWFPSVRGVKGLL